VQLWDGRSWRNARELRGVRSQAVAALNACDNGAYAEIDLKTLRNLIEVCDQALHIEQEINPMPLDH